MFTTWGLPETQRSYAPRGRGLVRALWSFVLAAGLAGAASGAHAAPLLEVCGDATGDGEISAPDALFALHVAVGIKTGSLLRCDCNESGTITASDAMLILKSAIGLPVVLRCPLPDTTSSTTTTSSTVTTTTSLAETCGNGTVDPGEDCDPTEGFCRGGCNPYIGVCVDFLCESDCSCPQPLCGDYLIDPDESCDPPGSECGGGTCSDSCDCVH